VRFARLFNRSVDFLLGLETDEPDPIVLWRDQGKTAVARAAEARFVRYCRDYAQLEDLAGRRPASFGLACRAKPTTFEAADRMGEDYSRTMKLGARPAISLLAALEEQHGVKLYVNRLEGAGSAASTRGSLGPAIMLNGTNAPTRRRYDAAHETFHLATWDLFPPERVHCASGGRSRVDVLANRFASALLMPESAVKAELRTRARISDWSSADYVTLGREFRVSAEAMIW
jgi:Zn-dependent peptidase ImmA (M78 family)